TQPGTHQENGTLPVTGTGCHDPGMSIFETFMGLPLHPLVIHVAVVAVPMLALAGIVYAFVPRLRGRGGCVAVLLALFTPLTVLVSKLAGDAFRARIEHKKLANAEI